MLRDVVYQAYGVDLRVAIQHCSKDVLSKSYRFIHVSDTFYGALVYFYAVSLFFLFLP